MIRFLSPDSPQQATTVPVKTAKQIVQEIHDQFDRAEDVLLLETERNIAKLPDTSRGQRLENLGFRQSPDAKLFRSTEYEKVQLMRNAFNNMISLLRKGIYINFTEDKEAINLIRKVSPPLYDKFYRDSVHSTPPHTSTEKDGESKEDWGNENIC